MKKYRQRMDEEKELKVRKKKWQTAKNVKSKIESWDEETRSREKTSYNESQ